MAWLLQDPDDLSFEKGEVLSLVRKDEEQWWTCVNSRNEMGLVPVPYIERVRSHFFCLVLFFYLIFIKIKNKKC